MYLSDSDGFSQKKDYDEVYEITFEESNEFKLKWEANRKDRSDWFHYTGKYEFENDVVTLDYDLAETWDDLADITNTIPEYSELDDDKYSYAGENLYERVNYFIDQRNNAIKKYEPRTYRIYDKNEKLLCKDADEWHSNRKSCYEDIALSVFNVTNDLNSGEKHQLSNSVDTDAFAGFFAGDDAGEYAIFCSDRSMNYNIGSKTDEELDEMIKMLNVYVSGDADLSRYTEEEGLTKSLDLSKQAWIIVTHKSGYGEENPIYAVAVADSIDSDYAGIYGVFYYNGEGKNSESKDKNEFNSIRELYNSYIS